MALARVGFESWRIRSPSELEASHRRCAPPGNVLTHNPLLLRHKLAQQLYR